MGYIAFMKQIKCVIIIFFFIIKLCLNIYPLAPISNDNDISFLNGRVYDVLFIESERSRKQKTIVFDLSGTIAFFDEKNERYTIRPGIEEQLNKLLDNNIRLVLWTGGTQTEVINDFLKFYPSFSSIFDLLITSENFFPPTPEELVVINKYKKNPIPSLPYNFPSIMKNYISFAIKLISLLEYDFLVDDSEMICSFNQKSPFGYANSYQIKDLQKEDVSTLADRILKSLKEKESSTIKDKVRFSPISA